MFSCCGRQGKNIWGLGHYVCWAHRLFILSCVSDKNVSLPPVSVRDGVKALTSTNERTNIVYERQRRHQSATGRRATATKQVASAPTPQLNRHSISLDRTAVAEERNWVVLRQSSNKNRQCVIVALVLLTKKHIHLTKKIRCMQRSVKQHDLIIYSKLW